jgi:hypothetical protein
VPRWFARFQERPTRFPGAAATVGYVVTVQADGYHALKVTGIAVSRGAGHTPVAAHTAVAARSAASRLPRSAVDRRLPANAAMLAARAPLAAGTVYHVRISGYVQATAGGRLTAWMAPRPGAGSCGAAPSARPPRPPPPLPAGPSSYAPGP